MNRTALKIIILITCLFAYQAYALISGFTDAIQQSREAVGGKQGELRTEQNQLNAKKGKLNEAKQLGDQSKKFIDAWAATFPSYSHVSEIMDDSPDKRFVQVKNHAPVLENEPIKFGGREFHAERKSYEFAGEYAHVVNYIGVFQQHFELMSIEQIRLSRKGDSTTCEMVYLRPEFESFAK